MSHITIIIGSSGGQNLQAEDASEAPRDAVQITYTPPDDLTPREIGKEVAKRVKWIETLGAADSADT